MTAGAGLRRGDRDAGIEIQLFAERRFLWRVGVFLWERDQRRTPVLCLHGINGRSGFRTLCAETGFSDNRGAEAEIGEPDQTKAGRDERTTPGGTWEDGDRQGGSAKRSGKLPPSNGLIFALTGPGRTTGGAKGSNRGRCRL